MNWDAVSAIAGLLGAVAVVVSLLYLAHLVRASKRLACEEAYRSPNSDLNSLNASFHADPVFRKAFRSAFLEDATREDLEPDERTVPDGYLISITNIFGQLAGEAREGIIDASSINFSARGIFALPYYQTSWNC